MKKGSYESVYCRNESNFVKQEFHLYHTESEIDRLRKVTGIKHNPMQLSARCRKNTVMKVE